MAGGHAEAEEAAPGAPWGEVDGVGLSGHVHDAGPDAGGECGEHQVQGDARHEGDRGAGVEGQEDHGGCRYECCGDEGGADAPAVCDEAGREGGHHAAEADGADDEAGVGLAQPQLQLGVEGHDDVGDALSEQGLDKEGVDDEEEAHGDHGHGELGAAGAPGSVRALLLRRRRSAGGCWRPGGGRRVVGKLNGLAHQEEDGEEDAELAEAVDEEGDADAAGGAPGPAAEEGADDVAEVGEGGAEAGEAAAVATLGDVGGHGGEAGAPDGGADAGAEAEEDELEVGAGEALQEGEDHADEDADEADLAFAEAVHEVAGEVADEESSEAADGGHDRGGEGAGDEAVGEEGDDGDGGAEADGPEEGGEVQGDEGPGSGGLLRCGQGHPRWGTARSGLVWGAASPPGPVYTTGGVGQGVPTPAAGAAPAGDGFTFGARERCGERGRRPDPDSWMLTQEESDG